MKIKILNDKVGSIFFEGNFYETKKEIEVAFSQGIKMSKLTDIEFVNPVKNKYNPELFHKYKKFSFIGDIDTVSGWGNVSLNLLKNSPEYNISLIGRLNEVHDIDILTMVSRDAEESGAMIWHEQPKETWENTLFPKNIAIVPFETTIIPASWITRINKFDALFVPCKQNMEAFRNSGVTIPIELIHWGVDTTKFHVIQRSARSTFTFGTMGHLSIRKGTDTLVDAFREAFPPNLYPDVRLICKTSNPHYPFLVKDDRITVQILPVSHEELMDKFFREIDCFVFPTRGEGFGLTPLEAMATGVPAIVTGWSGPEEYMNDEVGWKINYKMVPAKAFTEQVYKEECGMWSEPSKEHLKELMIFCYNNQDIVKEKGKKAAEYVEKNWTWNKKIKMFHNALSKYL